MLRMCAPIVRRAVSRSTVCFPKESFINYGGLLERRVGLQAEVETGRYGNFLRHTSSISREQTPDSEFWRRGRNSGKLGYSFLFGGICFGAFFLFQGINKNASNNAQIAKAEEDSVEHITNWSGTHQVEAQRVLRPESIEELEAMVAEAHATSKHIRPLGSGISPNGIAFNPSGMLSLAALDTILNVDPTKCQIRVQAGARVEQVVEALRPHGLTLENYASVKEQQIGGFIQVSAHGSGARSPPVDQQVLAIKLVTPSSGSLELTPESDPELFQLARCSVGTLGVVAEVTLQCVPAHRLLEETFVADMDTVKRNHRKWLEEYQHLRYMWVPHTPSVVVVRSNPVSGGDVPGPVSPPALEENCVEAAVKFYTECLNRGLSGPPGALTLSEQDLCQLSFTEIRDVLLSLNPLDVRHVAAVNKQEEHYWKLKQGSRIGWSDQILGFDCGGQQWVSEVCFPARAAPEKKGSWPWNWVWSSQGRDLDLEYMEELLRLIERENIPAPAPIEQRWSLGSQSPLSPASSVGDKGLYSWVGIIMYLPTAEKGQREQITKRFLEYKYRTGRLLWDKYGAREHWAKIEVPEDEEVKEWLKAKLKKDYPLEILSRWREKLDPKNILSNELIDELLPRDKLSTA